MQHNFWSKTKRVTPGHALYRKLNEVYSAEVKLTVDDDGDAHDQQDTEDPQTHQHQTGTTECCCFFFLLT